MTILLLAQIRPPGHPMTKHELECMQRRFEPLQIELRAHNVFEETPSTDWLQEADGFLIGGSGAFSVHDPRSDRFVGGLRRILDTCLRDDIPVFGICFGHQLLGMHLGSRVVTDTERREIGTLPIELTEAGRQDPFLSCVAEPGKAPFGAILGHTDHVESLPSGATLLARTDLSPIQAMRVDGTRTYSTQFHPDLTGEESRARYRAFAEALGPAEKQAMEATLERFDPEPQRAESLLRRFITHIVHSAESD